MNGFSFYKTNVLGNKAKILRKTLTDNFIDNLIRCFTRNGGTKVNQNKSLIPVGHP